MSTAAFTGSLPGLTFLPVKKSKNLSVLDFFLSIVWSNTSLEVKSFTGPNPNLDLIKSLKESPQDIFSSPDKVFPKLFNNPFPILPNKPATFTTKLEAFDKRNPVDNPITGPNIGPNLILFFIHAPNLAPCL